MLKILCNERDHEISQEKDPWVQRPRRLLRLRKIFQVQAPIVKSYPQCARNNQ